MPGRPMDLFARKRVVNLDVTEKEKAINAIMQLRNKRIKKEKKIDQSTKIKTPRFNESEVDYYVSESRIRHNKRRGRK